MESLSSVPEKSFAFSTTFPFYNYRSCETTCSDLANSSDYSSAGSTTSLESEDREILEKAKKSYNRKKHSERRQRNSTTFVDKRTPVQKEITVMTIGSKTKAHMLVQAPPKVPYRVAEMCPNQGLTKRRKSAQRYRMQDPRTGGLFHRIKPRPIMMDTSRFPVNSLKNRSRNLQDRISDNFQTQIIQSSLQEDEIMSAITDPVGSPRAGATVSDTQIQSIQEYRDDDNGIQNVCLGNNVQTLSLGENRDVITGGVRNAGGSRDLDVDSQTKWRKPVPLESEVSPKELIETYEVECETKTASSPRRFFFKSRSKPKVSALTFRVKAEESVIDQNDAGKPLAPTEIKMIQSATNGNKLGKAVRRSKLGIVGAFSKSNSFDTKGSETKNIKLLKTKDKQLKIEEDGSVANDKIVYSTFGGKPTETIKLIRVDEDIVPPPRSSKVLMQIETCTVSRMDAKIRHGEMGLPVAPINGNITPGVDVVGKVLMCGDAATVMYGISNGDTVASLVGCGGNAKYINLDAAQLVRVPRGVAPISASIVIESYLPAFQALMLKVPKEDRYNLSVLNGKKVLIFGGISTVGQALIELSLLLGASQVYTTAITKHHKLLASLGAITVEFNPETWPQDINEQIDIAVDPSNFVVDKKCLKAMKGEGKLVCFGRGITIDKFADPLTNSLSGFFHMKLLYNVFEEWMDNLEGSKSDLSYLFGLLKQHRIDPQLAGTLRLNKVSGAHTFIDGKRRIQGTFVCLPFAK